MKKYIYILLVLLPLTVFADMGTIYLFKAKFVLKNGKNFIGYYEVNDYHYESLDAYRSDKGFQKLLNQEGKSNNYKVKIIKEYHVEPKTNFAFVSEKEVVSLRLDDLKFTVFYITFCPSYFAQTLNIVSNTTFKAIKNSKNLHFVHYQKDGSDAYVFAINPAHTLKEISKMSANLCEYLINKEAEKKVYSSEFVKKMEKRRKEFEKQNIFIFTQHYGGC